MARARDLAYLRIGIEVEPLAGCILKRLILIDPDTIANLGQIIIRHRNKHKTPANRSSQKFFRDLNG
ncbi:MAG: hypothetical protein ACKO85_15310 [Isosphaeraceae bacterium]